jgi:CheY-like chemotaxis protein
LRDRTAGHSGVAELLDYTDIEIVTVSTGGEAIDALTRNAIDRVVLDLRLPDITGFELIA